MSIIYKVRALINIHNIRFNRNIPKQSSIIVDKPLNYMRESLERIADAGEQGPYCKKDLANIISNYNIYINVVKPVFASIKSERDLKFWFIPKPDLCPISKTYPIYEEDLYKIDPFNVYFHSLYYLLFTNKFPNLYLKNIIANDNTDFIPMFIETMIHFNNPNYAGKYISTHQNFHGQDLWRRSI